jgi:hypothetical protein
MCAARRGTPHPNITIVQDDTTRQASYWTAAVAAYRMPTPILGPTGDLVQADVDAALAPGGGRRRDARGRVAGGGRSRPPRQARGAEADRAVARGMAARNDIV